MLWRSLNKVKNGFYVDVGAAWPDNDSVTKAFYDTGWSGINIEPNPEFIKLLRSKRPRDINLGIAVGERVTELDLKIIKGTGLSTLDDGIAREHEKQGWSTNSIKVDVKPLSEIFEEHLGDNKEIHFLKVDAEGFEGSVLRGNNWRKFRPWVVLLEATLPLSTKENFSDWEHILLDVDYQFVYADGLNRFYLAKERSQLAGYFKYPPNVFDEYRPASLVELQGKLSSSDLELDRLHSECEVIKEKYRSLQESLALSEERSSHAFRIKEQMEASLSWKLTKPLRVLNPRRVLSPCINLAVAFFVRFPTAALFVKRVLKRYPRLWVRLKNVMLFDNGLEGEPFQYIKFDKVIIAFAKGPLKDQRGIGRVTRELLGQFKQFGFAIDSSNLDGGNIVHFFSSVHWCPEVLPPRSVVMVHDVIPMIYPEIFPEVSKEWHAKYLPVIKQADKIVTISESSAEDIAFYSGISSEKIEVIYNGVSKLPVVKNPDLDLPDEPYFVFFGSHDVHKNVEVVLRAFQDDKLNNVRLLMIGDNDQCKTLAKELSIEKQVCFLGRLSDGEAGYVIQGALALLFPSLYEGFGLPPLEAALLGTPSVCSNRPAMTELLEGAAVFVDPTAPEAWVNALFEIYRNDDVRESLAEKAGILAEQYTWKAASNRLLGVLSKDIGVGESS